MITIDDLAQALDLGPNARDVFLALTSFYDRLDEQIQAQQSMFSAPCSIHCDSCCHEAVFVSAPEFLMAVDQIVKTKSLEARHQLLMQMEDIALRFSDELELLETISPGAERDEVAARIKFRCPLLDHRGACSIYPARELNARIFGVSVDKVRNEPYGCEKTFEAVQIHKKRLPVLHISSLIDARDMRKQLRAIFPKSHIFHVYPWWFARFGRLIADIR